MSKQAKSQFTVKVIGLLWIYSIICPATLGKNYPKQTICMDSSKPLVLPSVFPMKPSDKDLKYLTFTFWPPNQNIQGNPQGDMILDYDGQLGTAHVAPPWQLHQGWGLKLLHPNDSYLGVFEANVQKSTQTKSFASDHHLFEDNVICVKVHATKSSCENAKMTCQNHQGKLLEIGLDTAGYLHELQKSLKSAGSYWVNDVVSKNQCALMTSGGTLTTNMASPGTSRHSFLCQSKQFSDVPHQPVKQTIQGRLGLYLSAGHPVHSRCMAWPGVVGRLSWMLRNTSGVYRVDARDPRFTLSSTRELDPSTTVCLRKVVTDLVIEPVPGQTLNENLTCVVHPRDTSWGVWKDCRAQDGVYCETKDLQFKCDHRPRLEVKYHTSDQDVIYGRALTSSCSALFSPPGNISWILDIKPYGVEEIPGNDSRLEYSQGVSGPCVSKVISHLRLAVDVNYRDLSITCLAYHLDRLGVRKKPLNVTVALTSQLKYGPKKPVLTLDYHTYPFGVVLGRNLTATCSACLGDVGNISWAISDLNSESLPPDILDGLIQNMELIRVDNVSHCGSNVTSHLVLKVTQALHLKRLECSSYGQRYLASVLGNLTDTSSFLKVYDPNDTKSPYTMSPENLLPLLLISLLVIMCLFCIRNKIDKKMDRDDSKLKGHLNQRLKRRSSQPAKPLKTTSGQQPEQDKSKKSKKRGKKTKDGKRRRKRRGSAQRRFQADVEETARKFWNRHGRKAVEASDAIRKAVHKTLSGRKVTRRTEEVARPGRHGYRADLEQWISQRKDAIRKKRKVHKGVIRISSNSRGSNRATRTSSHSRFGENIALTTPGIQTTGKITRTISRTTAGTRVSNRTDRQGSIPLEVPIITRTASTTDSRPRTTRAGSDPHDGSKLSRTISTTKAGPKSARTGSTSADVRQVTG